jgi:RNA polymerase sigma-70 factor (ECF subfamily)
MEDFETWYQREHPRVLAACAALTGDLDAAGEATDEAFARAMERWPTVGAMASPGGWIQVVALNHLRRYLSRHRQERALTGSRDGTTTTMAVEVPDPWLWATVARLPPRQRTAVLLRYVHDLPEADIAQVMGISRGAVASTLAAAQTSLRRRLASLGDGVSEMTPGEETRT